MRLTRIGIGFRWNDLVSSLWLGGLAGALKRKTCMSDYMLTCLRKPILLTCLRVCMPACDPP